MSLGLSNYTPDEDPPSNRSEKKWLLGIAGVTFFLLLGLFLMKQLGWIASLPLGIAKQIYKEKKAEKAAYEPDNLRSYIVSYLSQPRFAGREFEKQILGDLHLELYFVDTHDVILSMSKADNAAGKLQAAKEKVLFDPTMIEAAREENGYFKIGRFGVRRDDQTDVAFRTTLKNIRIDPNQKLDFTFQRATYTMTLQELADFILNKSIYGGMLRADTGQTMAGSALIFYNHGAYVGKAGEPSLKRLVEDLTRDLSPSDPQFREKRLQRLLDFVSNEISYDDSEALASTETLKRPNETLMSRRSDCSNKTILLCSLLEQTGDPYLMLYCPHHITVAVQKGGFPATNGYTIQWFNKDWVIAETTLAGFKIGETRVQQEDIFKDIRFVQQPDVKNVIFNAKSGQTLEFR
jgi:hypothetical protein